ESVRTYGKHWGIRSTAIYGGVGYAPQVRSLRFGPDVVVATPGRLLDHVGQRTIDLSFVEILVLDEADRMLDMGFIRDIRRVLEVIPKVRQNLLFSATFSDEIRTLASGFMHDPASVQVTPRNSAAPLVTQVVHPVDRERKRELLSQLVRSGAIEQALVFTRTKHGANRLAEQLGRDGIGAVAIHGNKSQPQRVRALADFKAGRSAVLVATEIAARGLDIDQLPHVVNYELPMVPEDYVHRIGRTGRAGTPGHAVSLVCVDEMKLLHEIERVLGAPIPSEVIAGFEPDRSIRPEPILRGGLGRTMPAPRRGPRPGADRGGYAPARRPSGAAPTQPNRPWTPAPVRGNGGAPGYNDAATPRGGQPVSNGPRRGPGGPRPADGRGGGVPTSRSANGRPNHNAPRGPRPGQSIGQRPADAHGPRPQAPRDGRSGGRPSGGQGGRPRALPGERLSRGGDR
ncbi:MAG TPA: helicase-related protein, partial [Candidatus Saccharimonadales bacterium]|nr:helicase-related protein [Candidatus Saccharimonadales bacterium]